MYKKKLLFIKLILVIGVLIWYNLINCQNDNQNIISYSDLNFLDQTDPVKASNYSWPAYNPTISYNFVNEYGNVPTPTNVLNDCSGVAGTQSSDWWCFKWGSKKNSLVTTSAITPMLARLNTDFAYFRNVMGWPPDLRALKSGGQPITLRK
jgi:hypothetical protein